MLRNSSNLASVTFHCCIFLFVHLPAVCVLLSLGVIAKPPNIVFILTDDQDITLGGMVGMTKTQQIIVDQGLTFKNSFVSSPICCVSRSSIMSGRYVHNHHVTNNSLLGGCSNETWQQDIEPTCFAVAIQKLGYTTFYSGKYLNQYGVTKSGGFEHIPLGWDHWFGLIGNSKYYNYSISNNGVKETHADNYYEDYYTDLIHNQSIHFLNTYFNNNADTVDPPPPPPFLMVLATPAAHGPFTPAPQYANYDADQSAPRVPNFNDIAANAQKHELFKKYITTPLTTPELQNTDNIWRHRHGTLQSVDDMIQDIYAHLQALGVLNNTYFVYFSDNGFQDGQFGQIGDKRQLYENDIRVPFFIRGPGIEPGSSTDFFALNIDIAPTLIELANGEIPQYMDGMSLIPYIFSGNANANANANDNDNGNGTGKVDSAGVKQQFLVEYYGEIGANKTSGLYGGNPLHPIDEWNNTYDCIRMIDGTTNVNQVNGSIYCQFKCYTFDSHVQIECPDKSLPQFYGECYDLDDDYYELNNIILGLNASQNHEYMSMLNAFTNCKGQTQCNALRQGTGTGTGS